MGTELQIQHLRTAIATGVRPVTIRQLDNATQAHSTAPFLIDDIKADEVIVVAHVIRIRRFETVTFLDLEDGTGSITAKRWLNGRSSDGLPTDEKPFYAHLVGHLVRASHESQSMLELKTFHIVSDPHQVFFHVFQVALLTLTLQRGPPPDAVRRSIEPRFHTGENDERSLPPPSAPTISAAVCMARPTSTRTSTPARLIQPTVPTSSTPSRSTRTPGPRTPPPPRTFARSLAGRSPPTSPSPAPSSRTTTPQAPGSRRASGLRRDPYANLTVLERAILLQILNATNASAEAVSMLTIVRGVSHHEVSAGQIGSALDSLVDQGHITPSADASHYAVKRNHYPASS
ncbi:hypothetical protein BD413DRAFT_15623 [Trametes elegans]|nr:hypothetical protein BD413DRAFT_15623 [Trametes elegans]